MSISWGPYSIIISLCTSLTLVLLQSAHSDPQVPCYFVFGDSLSDNGNNNALPTFARANYYPYGVDYPGKRATGRFNDGQSIVDIISLHLGFEESVPPFASTSAMEEEDLLKGVNYASGAAGIRQETGEHLGVRIPLDKQLGNHETVISRISGLIRNEASYLSECLYTINIGSDDYLNNYYRPESVYTASHQYTPPIFAQQLIQQYSQQIKVNMSAQDLLEVAPDQPMDTPFDNADKDTLEEDENGLTLGKKWKLTSVVWAHFTLATIDGKAKAVCKYCSKKLGGE